MGLTMLAVTVGCGKVYRMGPDVMEPTIRANQLIRIDRDAYRDHRPDRWDIVVRNSYDSRFWGEVSAQRILGKVLVE